MRCHPPATSRFSAGGTISLRVRTTFSIATVTPRHKRLVRSARVAGLFIRTTVRYDYRKQGNSNPRMERDPPAAAKAGQHQASKTHG